MRHHQAPGRDDGYSPGDENDSASERSSNRLYPPHHRRTAAHRRHGANGSPDGDPSDSGSSGDGRYPSRHGPPGGGPPGGGPPGPPGPLEIQDPLDKEDHQEYLNLKEKEDILVPQDLKDHQDPQEE